MSFTRLVLPLGCLAVVLAASPSVRAQACSSTAPCPQGFMCVPAPIAQPEPAPTCPSGVKCATAEPAMTGLVAPPSDAGYCAPAPCKVDSDCGTSMVCHTETYSQCAGGTAPACKPNTTCDVAPPMAPVCTDMTVSMCAYKWQLPCNTDVECGAGFNCMPTVSGMCSGSAGTGGATPSTGGGTAPSAGIAAPVPPDAMCTTTTSFPGYCQPKATTCTADIDCPATWTCADGPATRDAGSGVVGSGTATSGTTSAGDAKVAPAPTADPALPAPAPGPSPTTTKMCQSPLGTFYGGDTKTTGGGTSGGTPQTPNAGGNVPPTEGNPGSTSSAGGCAVGGGAGRSAVGLALALLAIVIARRRR